MIKQKISYVDLDGKSKTVDLFFHMNKLEIIKLVGKYGDLEAKVKALTDAKDMEGMINFLEAIILAGYGKREGDKFVKTEEMTTEFENSEAFAELFEYLLTNQDAATAFFAGVGPKKTKAATGARK